VHNAINASWCQPHTHFLFYCKKGIFSVWKPLTGNKTHQCRVMDWGNGGANTVDS